MAKERRTLSFKEAMEVLQTCHKTTLTDSNFGDEEMDWMRDGEQVAWGYYSSRTGHMYINFYEGRWYLATRVEDQPAERLNLYYKSVRCEKN